MSEILIFKSKYNNLVLSIKGLNLRDKHKSGLEEIQCV